MKKLTVKRMKDLIANLNDNDEIGIVFDNLTNNAASDATNNATYAFNEHEAQTYVLNGAEHGAPNNTLMLIMNPETETIINYNN